MIISAEKIKFDNRNISQFQNEVYKVVLSIPKGSVSTYKSVAEALNCKSYRAIGNALRSNPFAPDVPCHRVIKTNLTIGGFEGSIKGVKIDKKLSLLKKEGVDFKEGKLVDRGNLFTFTQKRR